MPITAPIKREQLIRDGFCVFEQVLDSETVAPEEVQALVARHVTDTPEWSDWVTRTQSITRPLIPVYAGAAEPPAWCPAPGAALR